MIDDPELLGLFKAESEEHLARLDDGLLRLEKTPADPLLLEDIFRESHSLKGAARMLGLNRVEAAAHELESIFNAARKGESTITAKAIEGMNAALTDLRRLVQEALMANAEGAMHPPGAGPAVQVAETTIATLPNAEQQLRSAVPTHQSAAETPQSAITTAQSPVPFHIDTVRVETCKLDDLLTQVGELAVMQGRERHRMALIEEILERWTLLERRRNRAAGLSARHGSGSEALEQLGRLLKQARDSLFDDSVRMEATVNLLADQVRSMRLLPVSRLFTLFVRMARDIAREQGKEAELHLEGGDIAVDKRILEEMKDPLMHLIRNAIDHGIEPPAERERLGKPRVGSVRLCAARENSSVRLEVRDDGRGLNLATIKAEAKKRGLFDEEALAAMNRVQLQQLVLMHGFSTSTFVTELSGRGVGLDVVRVNVERMKGSIVMQSEAGRGLTVKLLLPQSLATTRILLAGACGQLFGLPVDFVHNSLRVRESDIFTLEGRTAILLAGEAVMVVAIEDLLQLSAAKKEAAAPQSMACIVLQIGDERLGLLVDDLLSEEEVVPKPLGAPLARVRNVSALAMLASGEITAVLNPADLLCSAHKRIRDSGYVRTVQPAPGIARAKPAILLVEDSALIRAMEKRILEDGGYEAITAVDGVDALNILGSRLFAAVVSDIVMPNMDGLTLASRIRQEPRYKDMPVILVTSLASDEDKRRGLDAGANAYIPKPSFDQRVLLETLKRLI